MAIFCEAPYFPQVTFHIKALKVSQSIGHVTSSRGKDVESGGEGRKGSAGRHT